MSPPAQDPESARRARARARKAAEKRRRAAASSSDSSSSVGESSAASSPSKSASASAEAERSAEPGAGSQTAPATSRRRKNPRPRARRRVLAPETDTESSDGAGRAPFRVVLRFAKPSAERGGAGAGGADSPYLLLPHAGQPFGATDAVGDPAAADGGAADRADGADGAAGAAADGADGADAAAGADGGANDMNGILLSSIMSALFPGMLSHRRTPPLERPYAPQVAEPDARSAGPPATAATAAATSVPAAAQTASARAASRASLAARAKRCNGYGASLTKEERAYFFGLSEDEKLGIMDREDALLAAKAETHRTPMRFKILASDMSDPVKLIVLSKLEQFQGMREGMGEYYKYGAWINAVARLPLGRYHPLPVAAGDPVPRIAEYLQKVRATLDATVYGHAEAKDQILRILAQWVSKPGSRGNCIGIQGPPGCGKTQLIKHGLCKALGLPFGFVALGGASDGSFLEGHGFTYEGSTYGKIAEVLMKAQVMNPVLFFDELDKVSQTQRGEEVVGILTHLTDATQNERFNDRYFAEIDLNLSKCLTVFTYNDPAQVNPILKDRMITIHVSGYSAAEKVRIARDHLLPEILGEYALTPEDVVFPARILEDLVGRVETEEGVRNLRRALEAIVGWLNMRRYVADPPDGATIAFPVTVADAHVSEYFAKSSAHAGPGAIRAELLKTMYV